jgi:DNA-binding MarR family transcriptional regulator
MKPDSLEIATDLRGSLAHLNRRLRREAGEKGLSVAKHSILGHLYLDGPKTPGALAAAEGVQPQSITRVLAELEESGLVLRSQDETDRRQFRVEITLEGQELLQRDARGRAIWLAAAMDSCLTTVEQEVLRLAAQIMDKVADGGQLHGAD